MNQLNALSNRVEYYVERLYQFLADKDAGVARRAATLIDNAVRSLESLPQRARPAGIPGVRELIVPFARSAYVLRYAYFASRGEIVILRI